MHPHKILEYQQFIAELWSPKTKMDKKCLKELKKNNYNILKINYLQKNQNKIRKTWPGKINNMKTDKKKYRNINMDTKSSD